MSFKLDPVPKCPALSMWRVPPSTPASVALVFDWIARGFARERLAVFAAMSLVLGIQVMFTSFLLGILSLRRA